MRENKFRVWCNNKNEYEEHEHVLSCNGKLYQLFNIQHVSRQTHFVEMFTGLTDKNGVEIYEGDICRMSVHDEGRVVEHIENTSTTCGGHGCYYDTWFSGYSIDGYYGDLKNIEVIGNIHEVEK